MTKSQLLLMNVQSMPRRRSRGLPWLTIAAWTSGVGTMAYLTVRVLIV